MPISTELRSSDLMFSLLWSRDVIKVLWASFRKHFFQGKGESWYRRWLRCVWSGLKQTVENLITSLTTIKYLIKKELQLLIFYVENSSTDEKTHRKIFLLQLGSIYIELCKFINTFNQKLSYMPCWLCNFYKSCLRFS